MTVQYSPIQRVPDWRDGALCAQVDNDLFFPEKGGSTREAKRVCAGCEVRAECLEFALATDQRFGVYGGLSERERRRLRPTGSLDVPHIGRVTDATVGIRKAAA